MRIDIVSVFPQMFESPFGASIIKRASDAGLVEIALHDLRDWTDDRHRTVDDAPYGGGAGMVMRPEPWFRAVEQLQESPPPGRVILLTPQGRPLSQAIVADLAEEERLILCAARYEGTDPVEAILRRATSPSDTVALARNYLHHGVYILHGEKDDNVPVEQGRSMNETLGAFHPDLVYHEEAGAGHWWGNRCVDWPAMFEFFEAGRRGEATDHVEFVTVNPGISAWSRWVGIEAQLAPLDLVDVAARAAAQGLGQREDRGQR